MSSPIYPASMLRLLEALIDEVKQQPLEEGVREKIADSIYETINTPKGKLPVGARSPNAQELILQSIFRPFSELFNSYRTLTQLPELLALKAPSKSQWTEAMLIAFIKESYFHELYICVCRMESFIKRVTRVYGKDRNFKILKSEETLLLKMTRLFLNEPINKRGHHVHDSRLSGFDSELHRLELLELLACHGKMSELNSTYKKAIKAARSNARMYFRKTNRDIFKLLKIIFDFISPLIVSRQGKLIYPNIK